MITWFDDPERVRVPLGEGQFIDVKKRLTVGEREDMITRMTLSMPVGEPAQLNRREVRTARVLAYLLGWSVTKHGTPVPWSPDMPDGERLDTLRAMAPEAFDLIAEALDTHILAMARERDEQKKMTLGAPALSVA